MINANTDIKRFSYFAADAMKIELRKIGFKSWILLSISSSVKSLLYQQKYITL